MVTAQRVPPTLQKTELLTLAVQAATALFTHKLRTLWGLLLIVVFISGLPEAARCLDSLMLQMPTAAEVWPGAREQLTARKAAQA